MKILKRVYRFLLPPVIATVFVYAMNLAEPAFRALVGMGDTSEIAPHIWSISFALFFFFPFLVFHGVSVLVLAITKVSGLKGLLPVLLSALLGVGLSLIATFLFHAPAAGVSYGETLLKMLYTFGVPFFVGELVGRRLIRA